MMKINDENIGKFFQDQLKDMEVQPDKAVWSNIKQQSGISSGLNALTKVALLIMGTAIVVSSYFLWQQIEKHHGVTEITQVNETVNATSDKNAEKQIIITTAQNAIVVEDDREGIIPEPNANKIKKSATTIVVNSANKQTEKNTPSDDGIEQHINVSQSNLHITKVEAKELKPEEEIYQAHYIDFSNDSETLEYEENEPLAMTETSVNSLDTITVRFSKNPTICFGEDAKLIVEGGIAYDWNTGANTSSLKVSPVEQSDYWVIVTDQNGHEVKHTFTVYIDKECTAIFVPSAFTPNGDGINDVFKAEGVGIQSFEMIVFNLEGQIVFETRNIEDTWDGSFKNQPGKPRMYFYRISYMDAKGNPHKKQGQVTLIK